MSGVFQTFKTKNRSHRILHHAEKYLFAQHNALVHWKLDMYISLSHK